MSNLLKLVLTILVSSAFLDKSSGHSSARRDEPDAEDDKVPADTAIIVVDAIREMLDDVEDGATASDLKEHVNGITFIVNGILADADVQADEDAAQEVIETVLAAIYGNDDADADDVKIDTLELDRAFALLGGLAEALYGIFATPEREGLYETLVAVDIAAESLIDTIEDIANLVVYTYDPEDANDDVDDSTEEGDDDGADDSTDADDSLEDNADDSVEDNDVTRRHAGLGQERFQ